MAAPPHTIWGLVQCFTASAAVPSAAAAAAAASAVYADSVANTMLLCAGMAPRHMADRTEGHEGHRPRSVTVSY